SAFDRNKTGQGLARAIRQALAAAGITSEDLDHVNAHALGSPEADAWEARGLRAIFGSGRRPVPVFAPASYFGNLGAGSASSELAASLLALQHRQVPRTLNYETPDPACPIPVTAAPVAVTKPHLLKTAFTDMGQCAAVVCRRWE